MKKFLAKDGFILLIGLVIGLGAGAIVMVLSDGNLPKLNESLFSQNIIDIGKQAPDFTLENISGNDIQLTSLTGKPVLINFWATWCGPCKVEMPMLEAYHLRFGDSFTLLAVNMQEDARTVSEYVNELGLDFQVLLDKGGEVSKVYRVQGLPTSYFVDSTGALTAIHIGVLSEKQIDYYLEKVGIR